MNAFGPLLGQWWRIWRAPGEDWNGPDGPGFNQRFIGEISADGGTIEGRWERGIGDADDDWELELFDHLPSQARARR